MGRGYSLGSLLNTITLAIGIMAGFVLGTSYANHSVLAQSPEQGPQIEEIQPMISGGTAAFAIFLAHEIEADSLVVNGYDVMKLQQGILNYLASRPDVLKQVKAGVHDLIILARGPKTKEG